MPKFFHLDSHAIFEKNNRLGRPLRIGASPLGNPGSATANNIINNRKKFTTGKNNRALHGGKKIQNFIINICGFAEKNIFPDTREYWP